MVGLYQGGDRTVAEGDASDTDPTLIERWLKDQQQWQRTLFNYFDSMMKNEEFLTHMGNAMRGSLLAGKPYPTPASSAPPEESPATDRLDQILFALHQLQGQVQDLLMALDEIRTGRAAATAPAATVTPKAARAKRARAADAPRTTRKRRTKP